MVGVKGCDHISAVPDDGVARGYETTWQNAAIEFGRDRNTIVNSNAQADGKMNVPRSSDEDMEVESRMMGSISNDNNGRSVEQSRC